MTEAAPENYSNDNSDTDYGACSNEEGEEEENDQQSSARNGHQDEHWDDNNLDEETDETMYRNTLYEETDLLQIVDNLETKLKDQRKRVLYLQQKLTKQRSLENYIQKCQEDRSDLASEMEDWGNYLKRELDKLAEEKKNQEAKIKELERSIDLIKYHTGNERTGLQTDELKKLTGEIGKLLETYIHNDDRELSQSNREESLKNKCRYYKKEIAELEETLANTDYERKTWREKAQHNENEIQKLKDEQGEVNLKVQNIQEEKLTLDIAIDQLRLKVQNMEQEKFKLETTIGQFQTTVETFVVTSKKWKEKAQDYEDEIRELTAEKKSNTDLLKEAQKEKKALNLEKDILETVQRESQKRISALTSDNEGLDKSLKKAQSEKLEVTTKKNKLKSSLSEAKTQLSALTLERDHLETTLSTIRRGYLNLISEKDQLETTLSTKKGEYLTVVSEKGRQSKDLMMCWKNLDRDRQLVEKFLPSKMNISTDVTLYGH